MTRPILQLLGIAVTIALVGYAAMLLLCTPEADEAGEEAIVAGEASEDEREELERSRERLRRTARGLALSPEGRPAADDPDEEAPPLREPASTVPYGSGEIDDQTARDGFDYAMTRVEDIVKSRRRLPQDEWDALYRETNDAFAALSMVLDAHDETQAAELEAAHERLEQGLRKVRVRGRKLAD
jgi:hypothetical protein